MSLLTALSPLTAPSLLTALSPLTAAFPSAAALSPVPAVSGHWGGHGYAGLLQPHVDPGEKRHVQRGMTETGSSPSG